MGGGTNPNFVENTIGTGEKSLHPEEGNRTKYLVKKQKQHSPLKKGSLREGFGFMGVGGGDLSEKKGQGTRVKGKDRGECEIK